MRNATDLMRTRVFRSAFAPLLLQEPRGLPALWKYFANDDDDDELRNKKRPRRAFGKRPPAPRKLKGKPGRPFAGANGGGPGRELRASPALCRGLAF